METSPLRSGDALILVDVQRDFCPGGALPVPEGDQIVPVLNDWIAAAQRSGIPVFASRDWHPPGHVSFQEQGGQWPAHCVQHSPGADFHPDLQLPPGVVIIDKGTDPQRDCYSALAAEPLQDELRRRQVRRLWIGGLALDVCVRATVLDALRAGFDVHLIADAVRAVNPSRADSTLHELAAAGALIHREARHG